MDLWILELIRRRKKNIAAAPYVHFATRVCTCVLSGGLQLITFHINVTIDIAYMTNKIKRFTGLYMSLFADKIFNIVSHIFSSVFLIFTSVHKFCAHSDAHSSPN